MARPFKAGLPIAPPIPNETAFYFRFFAEMSSIRDEAGRPLHEVDFRDEIGAAGIKRCPYSGSRRGRKMNWEALQVIAGDWGTIVEAMRYLRRSVLVEKGETAGEQAWRYALLPMFLPVYVSLKGREGVNAEVTTVVSGLFKVMLDVPTTLDLMLASEWSGTGGAGYTPTAILEYAEGAKILNNGEWTCAGPPGLIREVLTATCDGDGPSPMSVPSNSLHLDIDELGQAASILTQQYALSQAFQVATAAAMEKAFAQIDEDVKADQRSTGALSAYEKRRRILLGLCRDEASCGAVVGGFLRLASRNGRSDDGGAVEACAEELHHLVFLGGASPEKILETQGRAEGRLRSAVTALQQKCQTTLSSDLSKGPIVDFSRLDENAFPSTILRRRLQGCWP